MSEKKFTPCPVCKSVLDDENCIFATVKKVEDSKTVLCCCPQQEKINSGDKV
jgi:hypothetical protein